MSSKAAHRFRTAFNAAEALWDWPHKICALLGFGNEAKLQPKQLCAALCGMDFETIESVLVQQALCVTITALHKPLSAKETMQTRAKMARTAAAKLNVCLPEQITTFLDREGGQGVATQPSSCPSLAKVETKREASSSASVIVEDSRGSEA